MKKNLTQVDRVARIFIGAVILIIAAQYGSWWGLIGLVLIITGAIGYCGLYELCPGKSCCKTDIKSQVSTQAKDTPNQQPPVISQK